MDPKSIFLFLGFICPLIAAVMLMAGRTQNIIKAGQVMVVVGIGFLLTAIILLAKDAPPFAVSTAVVGAWIIVACVGFRVVDHSDSAESAILKLLVVGIVLFGTGMFFVIPFLR